MDDHALAADLATRAGALLLEIRQGAPAKGLEGRAIGDEGDRRSDAFLLAELARLRPDDAVLSEESADDRSRLDSERVWIVDPVDGTREYSEGRSDWAVHVALAEGGVITAAAVALPGQGVTLSTAAPPPQPPSPPGRPRILVSRSRPPEFCRQLAEILGGELVPMGSAGAKAMAVVQGEGDIYAHAGGQYEWDNAAPSGVALAAGLHVSRLDGSPMLYNNSDPWLPDLMVCHPAISQRVLEAVAAVV